MGFVCEHELSIRGSMMYKDEDYREALEMLSTGKLNLSPLITHRFPFHDFRKAYEFIDQHGSETLKVMIDVN